MNFEEQWDGRDFLEGRYGGVEAFQITDLQDAIVSSGRLDQPPRGGTPAPCSASIGPEA